MKHALAALLMGALLLLTAPAQAANTATAQNQLPVRLGQSNVIPYQVSIDTINSDLTVRTPAASNMVCVVGMMLNVASTTNVTFKSAASYSGVTQAAAGIPLLQPLGRGALFCTQRGEALIMQTSVINSTIMMYVIETDRIDLGKVF